jgi:hypothetical protein
LEVLGEDGGIILKFLFKEENCGMESYGSGQDSKEWPAVVNTLMKFGAP